MTTPSLASLLKRACEFDAHDSYYRLGYDSELEPHVKEMIIAARAENARLQPLIEAAAECVEALEQEGRWLTHRGTFPVPEHIMSPLNKLRALLEREKSK